MRTQRTGLLCALAVVLVSVAMAADISGKWTAQVSGRQGQTHDMVFNFKAEGSQLTGTVATPRGEQNISDGKVDGDDISFTTAVEFNGRSMKFLYKGKVSGDQINFTRQREGGGRSQEFTAKRSS